MQLDAVKKEMIKILVNTHCLKSLWWILPFTRNATAGSYVTPRSPIILGVDSWTLGWCRVKLFNFPIFVHLVLSLFYE